MTMSMEHSYIIDDRMASSSPKVSSYHQYQDIDVNGSGISNNYDLFTTQGYDHAIDIGHNIDTDNSHQQSIIKPQRIKRDLMMSVPMRQLAIAFVQMIIGARNAFISVPAPKTTQFGSHTPYNRYDTCFKGLITQCITCFITNDCVSHGMNNDSISLLNSVANGYVLEVILEDAMSIQVNESFEGEKLLKMYQTVLESMKTKLQTKTKTKTQMHDHNSNSQSKIPCFCSNSNSSDRRFFDSDDYTLEGAQNELELVPEDHLVEKCSCKNKSCIHVTYSSECHCQVKHCIFCSLVGYLCQVVDKIIEIGSQLQQNNGKSNTIEYDTNCMIKCDKCMGALCFLCMFNNVNNTNKLRSNWVKHVLEKQNNINIKITASTPTKTSTSTPAPAPILSQDVHNFSMNITPNNSMNNGTLIYHKEVSNNDGNNVNMNMNVNSIHNKPEIEAGVSIESQSLQLQSLQLASDLNNRGFEIITKEEAMKLRQIEPDHNRTQMEMILLKNEIQTITSVSQSYLKQISERDTKMIESIQRVSALEKDNLELKQRNDMLQDTVAKMCNHQSDLTAMTNKITGILEKTSSLMETNIYPSSISKSKKKRHHSSRYDSNNNNNNNNNNNLINNPNLIALGNGSFVDAFFPTNMVNMEVSTTNFDPMNQHQNLIGLNNMNIPLSINTTDELVQCGNQLNGDYVDAINSNEEEEDSEESGVSDSESESERKRRKREKKSKKSKKKSKKTKSCSLCQELGHNLQNCCWNPHNKGRPKSKLRGDPNQLVDEEMQQRINDLSNKKKKNK